MGVRLPAEYQEVVSLWSDANQYIDTGIIADNETGFFVDAQKLMNNHNDTVVIGSRENSGSTRCWIDVDHSSYDGRLVIGWNGYTPVGKQQAYLSTNRFTASVNYKNTRKVFVNGAEHAPASSQLSVTLATQTHSLYLFGANYAGKFGVGFCGRIFACKISKGITIIADYVPCYRKADNKPGMYDLISQSFLTNQGTGEFLVGPDVIDSISPWLVARRRALTARKPFDCPYVTDGLVLWLDGINKGNTPNAWDDLISGYSFEDYYGQVVFGSDYVEFADNKNCYLYNQDFDVPRYTDGTIEIVYETNIAHAQILFCPKSQLSIAYGVGAGSVIWVKNAMAGTRPNMYKYPRFTSGSVSISLNSAYYDGAVQQNTGIDIWSDDDCASTAIGKTYYRDDRCFGGKIYCIRIYNRQLTEAEVLANYAVDRSRFSLFN